MWLGLGKDCCYSSKPTLITGLRWGANCRISDVLHKGHITLYIGTGYKLWGTELLSWFCHSFGLVVNTLVQPLICGVQRMIPYDLWLPDLFLQSHHQINFVLWHCILNVITIFSWNLVSITLCLDSIRHASSWQQHSLDLKASVCSGSISKGGAAKEQINFLCSFPLTCGYSWSMVPSSPMHMIVLQE